MLGSNKAIILGTLGKDPELRKTEGGTSVVNFSVATSERFTDRAGNKQEKTEWHSIVVWGKLADLTSQYLKKGSPIYLEGKISTREWDDTNGVKRYKTEIVANIIQFIGKKPEDQSSPPPVEPGTPPPIQPGTPPPVEDDLPF
jgi:single-strand DNA-binding protein